MHPPLEWWEERFTQVVLWNPNLLGKGVFLAHERGGWGPEISGNFHFHPFLLQANGSLICPTDCLKSDEQFKIVTLDFSDIEEAKRIFEQLHPSTSLPRPSFDWDPKTKALWLLAPAFPVVHTPSGFKNNYLPIDQELHPVRPHSFG